MINTRRITLSLLFMVVLILVAAQAHALVWNRLYQYYADSGFSCLVGEQFLAGTHCPDDESPVWGTTGNYRRVTTFQECGTTSGGSSVCAQYVNGSWQPISCP